MFKSVIGVAVALAGLCVPTLSSADEVPTLSGTYQMYGQRTCAPTDKVGTTTLYTGEFIFNPATASVHECMYIANDSNRTLNSWQTDTSYSVTADSVTIGGPPSWKAIFRPSNQGIVRSVTLIGVFDNGSTLCPSQMLLIR